jgi:hypothetical protein
LSKSAPINFFLVVSSLIESLRHLRQPLKSYGLLIGFYQIIFKIAFLRLV